MDSQPIKTNVTKPTELTDLEDRSRFLKSLGFARDRMTQGNNAIQNNDANAIDKEDDGMMLSSNFEDDLELPGSSVPMDSSRSLSEPFGLGGIDLGGSALDEEVLEIETRFAEESSFDLAGVDDVTWNAVNHRLRPEPTDWEEAEATLEADLKKKTASVAVIEPVVSSDPDSETRSIATPPPLVEEDDVVEVHDDSSLDREIEKAAEPPSNDDEPPQDESLTVNCPSCERGLTLQPEHLGIPGSCVWCETPIIAASSGVDHSVGVFELAVEKPDSEEDAETPPKPTAEAEIEHSKLADLPAVKTSPLQADEPALEAEETETVTEVAPSLTDEISKEDSDENFPAESSSEADAMAELPPKTEEPDADELVEAVPEPKNNFPWNAPTAARKTESVSKLVPPPIEVESELLLDEITEPEEIKDEAPIAAVPPLEAISEPKAEKKPEAIKLEEKEPLPPINSPLPELDTAALSSMMGPTASPFDPPVPQEESPVLEKSVAEPIQVASPFAAPAEPTQNEKSGKTPPPLNAVSPFDPPPSAVEIPAPHMAGDENNPAPFEAASPFDPPVEAAEKTAPPLPESTDPLPEIPPTATPFDSAPPEKDATSPQPLPWDQPNGESSAPATELPAVKSEPFADDERPNPVIDLPGTQGPLPPMNPAPAAAVSPTIEKSSRRSKKSGSSKGSRTAITIALLGLISGAGIASFFFPVGGYIEKAKSSWTEWFETKIGVENTWEQEAQPSPANEPVAIPAPPIPEPAPRTASGDEPDPFQSNNAPGS